MKSENFIFGIHIYRFPSLPLQELKKDMRTLKKLGFNTVKIQESWAIDERREGEVSLSDVEELAGALREYVASGGTLISEACPGRADRYGMARLPGMAEALRDVFGAEHEGLSLCGEGEIWSPPRETHDVLPPTELSGEGPYAGYVLRASFYLETYRLRGGRPILRCDVGVAGVMNDCGRGRGILIGTLAGHAVATYDHTGSRAFMLKLIADTGVKPERCGYLLKRRRVYGSQEAWCLINNSNKSVTEQVDIAGFIRAEDLSDGETVEIKRNSISVTVQPFSVRCFILSK